MILLFRDAVSRASVALAVLALAVACTRPPAELTFDPTQILTLDRKGQTVQLKVQTRAERSRFVQSNACGLSRRRSKSVGIAPG